MNITENNDGFAPLLKRSAQIAGHGQVVRIVNLDDEITLKGAGAQLFQKVVAHLDGKKSVGAIAALVGESAARIGSLARKLSEVGVVSLVSDPSTEGTMSGSDFYQLHHRYVAYWLREVLDHRLWRAITDGTATRSQVLGFAFEKYHYIEGAFEHMGIAAANATPEMMPHLARHFNEEYMHGDIYRKGLCSLFPNDVVLTAQPLPSTRALVNFLSESAARNSFSYYAGNELLQMTENTSNDGAADSVDAFYAAMRHHYPWSGKLIDSFIQHTNADQKLGHENVFAQMCASIPPLTRREVKDAMNTVKSMAEHLMLFMDGIDIFYSRFPTVPRVPCTLLSE